MANGVGVSKIAALLGVTNQTVWGYVTKGSIPFHRRPSGRLYFTEEDVRAISGDKPDSSESKWVYYVRSSSGDKTAMENQSKKLIHKYGKNAVIIKDSGSGLNENRKGLLRLIRMARNGDITDIAFTHKDRLTRFGYSYLENFFDDHQVRLHPLDSTSGSSPHEELMGDFMNLLASFAGRFYRFRSKESNEKFMKDVEKELHED